jgi:two-component system OmpR family sensor kinase
MVSLETRLKQRLLMGVLLVGIVLGVAVRVQVHRQQGEMLDYQLEQVARALILSDVQSSVMTWDDDPSLHLDVQVWDQQDNRLYRSSGQIELGPNTREGFSAEPSGLQADAVMLRVFTLHSPERTVQVMHSQALRDALSRDAELEVLLPTLLVMLIGAALVATTIRKGLAPIRELDDELSRRDPLSLTPVTLPHAPAELASVIRTLNRLLEQLDTSLQAHKRFIANAAHELRTPITALGLEVNNLAPGQDPAQMLATARRLKLGVQRTQHLLQQMLTLARLEGRTEPEPQMPVDLLSLVQEAMMGLSVMGSHRGIEFSLASSGATGVQGNPDDLRLLLDNLLVNALKFSPPNATVEVSLHQHGHQLTLLLRDQGCGIAPALRERIMKPFVRANAAIEGAGLGLSIAQEVALKHGATLVLEDPPEGPGLQVRVSFAAANPVGGPTLL